MKTAIVGLFVLVLDSSHSDCSSGGFVRLSSVVVSDTSTLVTGPHRTGNAVATWTSPVWTAYMPGSTWIWETTFAQDVNIDQSVLFHKDFHVAGTPVSGFLFIGSDSSFTATVNGQTVACAKGGNDEPAFDLTKQQVCEVTLNLLSGLNVLEITVTNLASGTLSAVNPGGLIYKLVLDSHYLV